MILLFRDIWQWLEKNALISFDDNSSIPKSKLFPQLFWYSCLPFFCYLNYFHLYHYVIQLVLVLLKKFFVLASTDRWKIHPPAKLICETEQS